jgi:hypothetical protein
MPTYIDQVDALDGPRLIDSFLVYIDALGTADALEGPAAAVEARFQSFRRAWREARDIAGLADPSWVATSIFSDLVVAALPIRDDGEAEWGSLVSTASIFQFFLAIEGVFVRGSFVRGNAWVDDTIAYGPALVRGYRMEQANAVYPRVIIAEDVQRQLRTYVPYYGGTTGARSSTLPSTATSWSTALVSFSSTTCRLHSHRTVANCTSRGSLNTGRQSFQISSTLDSIRGHKTSCAGPPGTITTSYRRTSLIEMSC